MLLNILILNFVFLFCLLNLSQFAMALKVRISPLILIKEMKSVRTLESLFTELTKFTGKSRNSRLRLLAALLKSPSIDQQYIINCKTFSIFTFLCFGFQVRNDPTLDVSRIMSPDCIAASGANFSVFEDKLAPFIKSRGSSPVLSSNFKPSQWTTRQLTAFLNEAASTADMDWSSWCGDSGLTGEHFSSEIWNNRALNNNLWKFLNYKCIERMTIQSKRIMLRSRYPLIFKTIDKNTQKHLLMKIISLCAAQINLKSFNEGNVHEFNVIKDVANSLMTQLMSSQRSGKYSSSIARTAAKLLRNCEIISGILPFVTQSPRNILTEVYRFLEDEPMVNDSWLLNFIYVALNVKHFLLNDLSDQKIIRWFFQLNPSVPNVCQLLEIIGTQRNQRFRESALRFLNSDASLLSKVHWQCPKLFSSLAVPLIERIKMILKVKMIFPMHSLKMKLLQSESNRIWSLVQLIQKHEQTIFIHNTAVFESGFNLVSFPNLQRFFEHFLDCFLSYPALYHVMAYSEETHPRPVIVPSLALPMKMLKILFLVLARAAILDFKVPFFIHFQFFAAAHNHNPRDNFIKALKLKRMFYKDTSREDEFMLTSCEQVNSDEVTLVDHMEQLCAQDKFHGLYYDSIVYRILEWQIFGINSALTEMFPKEIPISSKELYLFIFNRDII